MIDASSMRNSGRRSLAAGIPLGFFGILLILGGFAYGTDQSVTKDLSLPERIGYHVSIIPVTLVLGGLFLLPFINGVYLLVSANQVKPGSTNHKPDQVFHYPTVDDPKDHTGGINYNGDTGETVIFASGQKHTYRWDGSYSSEPFDIDSDPDFEG